MLPSTEIKIFFAVVIFIFQIIWEKHVGNSTVVGLLKDYALLPLVRLKALLINVSGLSKVILPHVKLNNMDPQ